MTILKHFKWSNLVPKFFKFYAWLKKCHFGNFSDIGRLAGLAMPCYCSPSKRLIGFFFLFYIFIYFLKYETIFRSSTWSFGHSDPDPSSVIIILTFESHSCHLIISAWFSLGWNKKKLGEFFNWNFLNCDFFKLVW